MSTRLLPLIVLLGALGGQAAGQERADWPRWRGASGDNTASTGTRIFDGPFDLRVRWKRTLGTGYSGIVVSAGRAVTMFSDGRTDFVVALSSDTGQEAWRLPLGQTFPARDGSTGGPVSTPAIDSGTVFAIGPRGNLVAASLADGRQIWTRDLVKDFGAVEPHWGFTTSPLPTGDVVIVAAGGTGGQAIVALDRSTGAIRWKAGDDTVSYQSPTLATIGGRELVVAATDRYLFGLDPRTGAEAWRHEHGGTGFFGRIVNPVPLADKLLLTYKPDSSILIAPGAGAAREVWTTRELKLSYAPPVVHDGLLFGYSGAFLTAVDAATGALKWRSRPPGDGYPILVDDHLVVFTKQGQLAVAAASGQGFAPKASIEVLSQLSWTPPSFADGRIFVRDSYEGIAAVDVVPSRRTTTPAPATRAGMVPGTRFAAWVAEVEKAPDAAARVDAFLAAQSTVPVVEGDRFAHILFRGDGKDLLLRSDALGTGVDWPLHRVGDTDLHYVSLALEPDARISYQFVRNLDETFVDPRNSMKATSQNFAGDVSLLLMPRADRTLPAPASALRGRIVDLEFDTGTATAAHLRWGGKRPVHVYLPPGYDSDPARRFAVVYVMYGEEMRTGGHLAAAFEAEMGKTIEDALIVFVPSTSGFEYARTFREPHMKMMAERLVPWIDGQFRTRSTAADRVLLGGDEAGFASVEIGLRYPQVFGRIAAQSLFPLSAGDAELMALIDRAAKTDQRFYVDWGRYDPKRRSDKLDVRDFSARVHARLKSRGFTVAGRQWNDGSTVLFWSARAVGAMRELLPLRH